MVLLLIFKLIHDRVNLVGIMYQKTFLGSTSHRGTFILFAVMAENNMFQPLQLV